MATQVLFTDTNSGRSALYILQDNLIDDVYPNILEVENARGSEAVLVDRLDDVDNSIAALASGSGVTISAADTAVGYLANKLLAGDVVTLTINNPGGVETLTITIPDDGVTYAKIQNVVSDQVLLGRISGAGGIIEEVTATQIRTLINVEDDADSIKTLLSAQGDIVYASAANVLARLAKGSANFKLFMNAAGTIPEWAIGLFVGSFTRDTSIASGNQAITGVGFKPSAVIFLAAIEASTEWSIGLDNSNNTGCIYHRESGGLVNISTADSIYLRQGGSSDLYLGEIGSLDADGFTIAWSKTGSKTGTATINYLAIR